jgi:uncharacterized membrane protein
VSVVPHVTQTKATVTARGKGVEVDLELHVDPDTNLALTSEEACKAVENLLTNRLSVEMARPPRLNIRYSELRLAGAPAPPAEEPPAVAEETESPAAAAETPAEAEVTEPPAAAAETPAEAEVTEPPAEAAETPAEAEGEGPEVQKKS